MNGHFFTEFQDSFDANDPYILEGDYHELKENLKNSLKEKNQLILKLKQNELKLNEQKSKHYLDNLDNQEDLKRQWDSMRLDFENRLNVNIKTIKEEYNQKLNQVELQYEQEIKKLSKSNSRENTMIEKYSFQHNSFKHELEQLNAKIHELEDKNFNLEIENKKIPQLVSNNTELNEINNQLENKCDDLKLSNKSIEQKLQSYKFLLEEKDRYIGSILTQNKSLVDQINSTLECNDTENESQSLAAILSNVSYQESFEVQEIIQSLQSLYNGYAIQDFTCNQHQKEVIKLKYTNSNLEQMIDHFSTWLGDIIENNLDDLSMKQINNEFAVDGKLYQIVYHQIDIIRNKIKNLYELTLNVHRNDDHVERIKRKLETSSNVIDEQTLLIGNLVQEVKRIKYSYKNTINTLKEDLFKEREGRLIDATKMENYCHEHDKQFSEISKTNRRLKEKIISLAKDNEITSSQLKFLVKQKVLLSQQIEEYECHVMQNFNNVLYSDDNLQ